jgi:hypothetical protein
MLSDILKKSQLIRLKHLLLFFSIILFLKVSGQRIVPELGFLVGGNLNTAEKCNMNLWGHYSIFGGIKINRGIRNGMDQRILLSFTNLNIKYYLKEISAKGAKSFMNDNRLCLDISLMSSIPAGKKSSIGLGIMLTSFFKSNFEAEYGASVDQNLSIGMNIVKANEDLKNQKVNYMPSILLSFRTPVFKIFGKQTGVLIQVRQSLLKIYHNPIVLEYGTTQQEYLKSVDPCITFIQTGLYF